MDAIKPKLGPTHPLGNFSKLQIGQRVQATVAANSVHASQQPRVEIGGNSYASLSSVLMGLGGKAMLQVVSVQPELTFAVVRNPTEKSKSRHQPATILSKDLALHTQQKKPESISNLLNFMNFLDHAGLQGLPRSSEEILLRLRNKFIDFKQLASFSRLRTAIADSGLLLESKLMAQGGGQGYANSADNPDLKASLFQLFRSLHSQPRVLAQTSAPGMGVALSSYSSQNNEPLSANLAWQLMHSVEEALSCISAAQKKTLLETTDSRQSWFFHLPLNYENSLLCIPLTLYRERKQRAGIPETWHYGAEFSVELPRSGLVSVKLKIADHSVSISTVCSSEVTQELLGRNLTNFSEALRNYGLTLESFDCSLDDGQ